MQVFANREVCDLIMQDFANGNIVLNWPYANTTTTSVTGESVFAYGGQGHPKIVPFYGEKGGTMAIETQMQSAELFSFMSGAAIENAAQFLAREELQATSGTITLTESPIEGSVRVYKLDDDAGSPVECEVDDTSVTLSGESSSSNDKFIVYYMREISTGVKRLNIKSTTFPKVVKIFATTFDKTADGVVVPYKMIAYKAAPQLNFEIAFSSTGDPATITITCDLLVDDDGNLLDMIVEEGA